MTDSITDTDTPSSIESPSQSTAELSNAPPTDSPATDLEAPAQERASTARRTKIDVFPVLEKLAALYPAHFGATFLPLKRGIFQDLLAAHPDAFERETLKAALSFHTRSTRYLSSVSTGQQRHDLQGHAVEAMAPEHVHHALLEVFRRRQGRTQQDLRPQLRARIVQAFESSGLSTTDYCALVHTKDEEANALLNDAMAEIGARAAKNEALSRAFEASGKTIDAFADMYGMDPQAVERMLDAVRQASLANAS
jgi:ProP effector